VAGRDFAAVSVERLHAEPVSRLRDLTGRPGLIGRLPDLHVELACAVGAARRGVV
jgi:hypothetical protein